MAAASWVHDGGVVATANVTEKPLCCRIDPADDSRFVEDVARDADALQSLLDVAADSQARGHHPKCGRFDGSGGVGDAIRG